MKNHRLLSYLMILALIGRYVFPVYAQSKNVVPKSVLDYFLLLPSTYFDEYETSTARRKKRLIAPGKYRGTVKPILDLKNDYILYPEDSRSPLTLTLFKHNGRVLAALHTEYEGERLEFLRYDGHRWQHVTRQVLPVAFDERYSYQLPRYGTTIKVTVARFDYHSGKPRPDQGRRVYDLVWSQGKFEVRR